MATLKNEEEERYTDFDVQVIADLAALSPEQRDILGKIEKINDTYNLKKIRENIEANVDTKIASRSAFARMP